MQGGVTWTEIRKMKRKDFFFALKRLTKQKIDETRAMEKSKSSIKPTTTGKMKYLGK